MNAHAAALDSYLDWWRAAGLSQPVQDTPIDWLARPSVGRSVARQGAQGAPADVASHVSAGPPAASVIAHQPPAFANAAAPLPDNLPEFERWLGHAPNVPGRNWSRSALMPYGPAPCPLMIIADMPDEDDFAREQLFSGASGALLDAMLAAIGFERGALRIASLAVTRPGNPASCAEELRQLAVIARHHIHLVRPQTVLLLGTITSEVMTGTPIEPEEDGLRELNHYGATTAAIAIHHPRVLLRQPKLKRMTWNAIKSLKVQD